MRHNKIFTVLFTAAIATLVSCDKQAGDGAEAVSAQNDSITTSVMPAQTSADLTPTDIDAAPVVTNESSASASSKGE